MGNTLGENGRLSFGESIEVVTTKWGDRPHYRYEVRALGTDQYGHWLASSAGATLRRDSEISSFPNASVLLVPYDAWWTASWILEEDTVATPHLASIYVNVTTPATWHESRVELVDLDLDVSRYRNGVATVLDEDEFEAHRKEYAYPGHVTEEARRSCSVMVRRLSDYEEPFKEWVDGWSGWFDRLTTNGHW